ncbi:MAG: DUF359 domain-containing protein [Thermoprotei archaeon]|mgnify:CR=1 FL=1|nr:MAG: DUF359 domain-containing protein [Thermoprotei archaeon]
MKALRLPEELRPTLQKPLGRLLKGPTERIYSALLMEASSRMSPRIIAVGDVVVEDSLKHGVKLDLAIVDYKTKRRGRPLELAVEFRRVVKVVNPPGHLSLDAMDVLKSLIEEGGGALMEVEGEEDLLTIPSVLYAPLNSLVIYGQPNEGVVLVVVDESSKAFFKGLLESFSLVEL